MLCWLYYFKLYHYCWSKNMIIYNENIYTLANYCIHFIYDNIILFDKLQHTIEKNYH